VFRPLGNELDESLRRDFETWVTGQEGLEHAHFVIGHEFDTIIDFGEGTKHIDECISRDYWIACFVQLGPGMFVENVVESLFDVNNGLTISTVGRRLRWYM
jgi:hypothetical protein